jgi:hypothetical protein
MRRDAKRSIDHQMLEPSNSLPAELPGMSDIRRAYNAWLDKRGFAREKFQMYQKRRAK